MNQINLKNIAYMNDEEFMKVFFSSADFFPGLYRYTLGTIPFPHDNLNHHNLFSAFMQQEHYGKYWYQNEWFAREEDLVYTNMVSETSRNKLREDIDLAEDLTVRAHRRYRLAKEYALAALDLDNPVDEILLGFTYYMMGTIVKFEPQTIHIGFDDLTKESQIKLNVPFAKAIVYIKQIMCDADISDLFLHCKVLAHLDCSGPKARIISDLELLAQWHQYTAPVFAAPIDYRPRLPIMFAKPIGVSNVTE